jgi:GNAT superfamily N-acetyltransferase
MNNKKTMMESVYNQLAIDYNCTPDDFQKDGLIFTEARKAEGRRSFPWVTPRLEMISMGSSVVINASADILPFVRKQLMGKSRDEVFWMPFVYGIYPYFLPDIDNITSLSYQEEFEYEMVEKQDIHNLYNIKDFNYALHYDVHSPNPEMLVALARYNGQIVGMAEASADCQTMWSIGVDILYQYRGKGLAATLVNKLTLEVLRRGYIPYYFTSESNVLSMHVAVRAGYIPAWVHSYKTRLDGILR